MDLRARFVAIDRLLIETQSLWLPAPFCASTLAWQYEHTALSDALLAIDDHALMQLENDDEVRLAFVAKFIPALHSLTSLLNVPGWASTVPLLPTRWSVDIPGRKWEQIAAFMAGLPTSACIADWCAGKSHLGRALLRSGKAQRVIAIERDVALCRVGEQSARKQQLALHFVAADVLLHPPSLQTIDQICALHACGDLHIRLLQHAVAEAVPCLTLAPCCYHLIQTDRHEPLSTQAQTSTLRLNRAQLHLAVEETVTSAERIRRQRDQLMSWRLAFDLWQREQRGVDEYMMTPSRPYSVLHQGLTAFVHDMCRHHQMTVPDHFDEALWMQRGQWHWRQVQRLQILRHVFRRALEMWLVLDRALYLQEQGYHTELFQFCPRQLTPRNLLIHATRHSD